MLDLSTGKNFLTTNYIISKYTLQAVGNQFFNRKDAVLKRQRALELTGQNARILLRQFNINVKSNYSKEKFANQNYFMVCNHMSYFDIIVLSSLQPSVFVTSVEMEKTFFLGDMAKLGGSFFVNRVNRRKMKEEVQQLINLLKQKFNVFIFPEGTSTDGSKMLPFKKALFRVPYMTQYPIMPICLKYKTINGEEFSPDNCDKICWYDDMSFGPHFLQLMTLKNLEVEVTYLDPLNPADFANHGDLALAAQEKISKVYSQP